MKKGDAAFGSSGCRPKDQQREVSHLKAENKRLKEEVEILKKAVYFSKESP